MTKLGTIALVLGIAAAGCSSDDKTTPTASGVFPANGFAGRTVRVEISGDATNWTDGATVDFGTGITASNVTVASPTDIFADIAIDPTATAGLSDVTVTSGGTFTLKQAFEIDTPIDIGATTFAQGSLTTFTISNDDFEHPFDTTTGTDPNTGGTIFPNINITGPAGTTFFVNNVTEGQISMQVELDVDAAASGTLTVTSGPTAGTPIMSELPMTVAATTPMALSGTVSGTIAAPGASVLYTLTAAANPSEVDFALPAPSDPNAQAAVIVLGPSGHWADFVTSNLQQDIFGDLLAVGSTGFLDQTGGKYYAIVFDLGSDSGYSYSLTGHTAAFTDAAESGTAHATVATAQVVAAAPGLVTPATITMTDTEDIYKFTVGTAGKFVHAVTFGDNGTDTAIEIDDSSGATAPTTCDTPLTGDGEDDGDNTTDNNVGPEDTVGFSGLTGTTFCVRVSKGGQWSASNTDYQLAVWLEAAE